VRSNAGSARSGRIEIGGKSVVISQEASPRCPISVEPTFQSIPSAEGKFLLSVVASADCKWSATSLSPEWITILSGSGVGSGQAAFFVKPNYGSARKGQIRIGDIVITVEQTGFDRSGA
jgi:hypothetical protein